MNRLPSLLRDALTVGLVLGVWIGAAGLVMALVVGINLLIR